MVRDTLLGAVAPRESSGIGLEADPATGTPAIVDVTASLVERSHDTGLSVAGSEATLSGVLVRDGVPEVFEEVTGRGLHIQPHVDTGTFANVHVEGSAFLRNHDSGIFLAARRRPSSAW